MHLLYLHLTYRDFMFMLYMCGASARHRVAMF